MYLRLLKLLPAAFLAGCANFWISEPHAVVVPPVEPVAKPAPPVVLPARDFLKYCEGLRRMSAVELQRELEQARQGVLQEKSDWRRLQYGYLLLQPGHRQRDVLKALAVLDPLLKDAKAGEGDVRGLALLLSGFAQDMQRQDELLDGAAQKLKDEQRRADVAEERVLQLQLKLDGLKSLENSLYRRERMRH